MIKWIEWLENTVCEPQLMCEFAEVLVVAVAIFSILMAIFTPILLVFWIGKKLGFKL